MAGIEGILPDTGAGTESRREAFRFRAPHTFLLADAVVVSGSVTDIDPAL